MLWLAVLEGGCELCLGAFLWVARVARNGAVDESCACGCGGAVEAARLRVRGRT